MLPLLAQESCANFPFSLPATAELFSYVIEINWISTARGTDSTSLEMCKALH